MVIYMSINSYKYILEDRMTSLASMLNHNGCLGVSLLSDFYFLEFDQKPGFPVSAVNETQTETCSDLRP